MNSLAIEPSRTVVTSFTPRNPSSSTTTAAFEEGDWVLCLASSSARPPTTRTASAALSNGNVQVYDTASLQLISSFRPGATLQVGGPVSTNNNTAIITDLVYYGPDDNFLVSTAQDGGLVVTDLRQPATAAWKATLPSHGESALSVALGLEGQHVAAVSSDKAKVHFFDLRNTATAVLGSYVDSHSNAVTATAFCPTQQQQLLLTGGEDGLVCCFDTTQPTEELALQAVLNVGAPLRKVGFCASTNTDSNNSNMLVYCLTGSETASLWNIQTATCVHDFDGNNLRRHLSSSVLQSNNGKQQQPSAAAPMDYLVDAHWDAARQELLLVAGSCSGNAAVYSYNPAACLLSASQSSTTSGNKSNFWKLTDCLTGGHRGVVRDWCPLLVGSTDNSGCGVILTAGEDARLCEWDRQHAQQPGVFLNNNKRTAQGGASTAGPLRRQRHRPSANPY